MRIQSLDHVALWLADRDVVASTLTGRLGMHVIERTDSFTLVGSDARRGKLTLFAAEGPRERGALKHIALRVSDLGEVGRSAAEEAVARTDGSVFFDVAEGLRLGLVEASAEVEYDLDHVALYSADPRATATRYEALGFRPAAPAASGAPRVEAGGAYVEFHQGEAAVRERPLLNHLAVLVESAEEHLAEARELGLEIADVVDAANTYAVFVWGPEGVKIEYVEHKPSFSLV